MEIYHVVGIEDDHIVVFILNLIHSILHGFGLGTLLENGLQQGDGQFGELSVGLGLHVVGDDSHVERLWGIVLVEELADGGDDDAVFVVGRIEYEVLVECLLSVGLYLSGQVDGEWRHALLPKGGYQRKEQDIGYGGSHQNPQEDVDDMDDLPEHKLREADYFLILIFWSSRRPSLNFVSTGCSRMKGTLKKVLSHLSSTR